jgi:hypothetical protein
MARRFALVGLPDRRKADGGLFCTFPRHRNQSLVGGLCAAAPARCVWPGPLTRQFNAKCTTWIAGSIGDTARKEEWAAMWPGTRSEPGNLAAIHREHRHPQTCYCNRLHIRPCPKLVRQERKLQRRPQGKQSGSSAVPRPLERRG